MVMSYFSRLKSRKPIKTLELEELIELIRNPIDKVSDIIFKIRSSTDEREIKLLKKQLPGVTVSGKFTVRECDHLVEHSGLYIYDIDKIKNLESARRKVADIESLVVAFISPSGNGLKIILAGPTEVSNSDEHSHIWISGKKIIENLGLVVDKSGSDCSRLCFLSEDPDLIEGMGELEPFTSTGRKESDDETDLFDDEEKDFSAYNGRVIKEMLWAIGSDLSYDEWRNVIWGVVAHLGKKNWVKEMLIEWSTELGGDHALDPENREDMSAFNAIYRNKKHGVTLATPIKMAHDKGWTNWRSMLRRDDDMNVIKDDANLKIILEQHPDFKGRLWNDQITYDKTLEPSDSPLVAIESAKGGLVDEGVAFEVLCDIQKGLGYQFRGVRNIITAMCAIANRNTRNLRLEWLTSLKWDGKERIKRLFIDGFFAEDNERNEAVAVSFLTAAVARILKPGCAVHVIPILSGLQGTGKSTGIASLCPDPSWFNDSFIDMDSKAGYEVVMQSSIVELAELSGVRHSEMERVKQFVTQRTVRYREPYARAAMNRPATWVFIGTTNEEEFLKDPTGNRRWAVIKIKPKIDTTKMVSKTVNWVTRRRDQLWAEAFHLVSKGLKQDKEIWHLPTEWWSEFAKEADRAMESDPWEDRIRPVCETLSADVLWTLTQVADECGIRINTRVDQLRFARVLRKLNWEKVPTRAGKKWKKG